MINPLNIDSTNTNYYLDVRADSIDLSQALDQVESFIESCKQGREAKKIYFTNVHSILTARVDKELKEHINHADLVLPDGSGLAIAGKILKKPIIENLNGTDFTPKVCRLAEEKGWSVYLVGAQEEVVNNCVKNLGNQFPALAISGYHNGYFNEQEELKIISEIKARKPDIVLVALGTPYQEKWIARHAEDLQGCVCFAVGGLFDFLANIVKRAPLWMRKTGIEWLYRFMQDPSGKWRRIVVEIPVFLTRIMVEKAYYGRYSTRRYRKMEMSNE